MLTLVGTAKLALTFYLTAEPIHDSVRFIDKTFQIRNVFRFINETICESGRGVNCRDDLGL